MQIPMAAVLGRMFAIRISVVGPLASMPASCGLASLPSGVTGPASAVGDALASGDGCIVSPPTPLSVAAVGEGSEPSDDEHAASVIARAANVRQGTRSRGTMRL